MTELEALVAILEAAGDTPTKSLATIQTDLRLGRAKRLLDRETMSLLNRGYPFNTDVGIKLSPDPRPGPIMLSEDVLRIDVKADSDGLASRGVMRGRQVVNRATQTAIWSIDLYADVIRSMKFEDMPIVAQNAAVARASMKAATRAFGEVSKGIIMELEQADADILQYEIETLNANFLKDSADVVAGWRAGRHY